MITLNLPNYCQDCPYMDLHQICEYTNSTYGKILSYKCTKEKVCERMYEWSGKK